MRFMTYLGQFLEILPSRTPFKSGNYLTADETLEFHEIMQHDYCARIHLNDA